MRPTIWVAGSLATSPASPRRNSGGMNLQSCLQRVDDDMREEGAPTPTAAEPIDLLRHLEMTGRFHRDSGFGRIFHPSSVSLRENLADDALHVVVNGNHLAAHVDRVSPLDLHPARPNRYSIRRATAHNLAGAAHDLVGVLRGRQGDHRCELDCEWVWQWRPAESEPRPDDLLDPKASTWSVQLEARVAGALDEARLRDALESAVGRRPVDRELLDVVDCADDVHLHAARAELQSEPVGLTSWPPLRARLARHPAGDVLMLNLNHAATDGVGALQVLRSIAAAYAGGADPVADPSPVPDFLALSPLPVRPASAWVSRSKANFRSAVEYLSDRMAPPARLVAEEATDEPGYGFHSLCLSAEDTDRILNSERPGTSRNMLVAGLHLAIGEWNLRHGSPGKQVGVLVPVDLRPPDLPDELVANFSVTARISTSRRHRSGPSAVMQAVTAQTTRNKRRRTGVALLAGLHRSGLLPLWAKQSLVVLQPLTRNRFIDTAMLANLGAVDSLPSFGGDSGEITEVWYSSPARTPESLCIGVVILNGRMHLTFRYPHRLFGPGPARRFADCYVEQVRRVAATHWGEAEVAEVAGVAGG